MQVYRLLGTLQTTLLRRILVNELMACGWELKDSNDDEDLLRQNKVELSIEGEATLLIDANFKGIPEDIVPFFACVDAHQVHYALDLFGDSARLVRRFIK